MVNSLLIPILKEIDFSDRFRKISEQYKDYENRFVDGNPDEIQHIIQSFGYKFKFNKSEHFYKLVEKIKNLKIQFNIVVQRGTIEFIWGIEKDNKRLKMGGSICGAIEFLDQEDFSAKPIYSNYNDLHEILKEAFSIYEDFKREVIKLCE